MDEREEPGTPILGNRGVSRAIVRGLVVVEIVVEVAETSVSGKGVMDGLTTKSKPNEVAVVAIQSADCRASSKIRMAHFAFPV